MVQIKPSVFRLTYVKVFVPLDYSPQPTEFQAHDLFEMTAQKLVDKGEMYVQKVQTVFRVEVKKGEKIGVWIMDLLRGSGEVRYDPDGEGEITLSLSDDDAVRIWNGELLVESAVFWRQLKVRGNLAKAYRLRELIHGDPDLL